MSIITVSALPVENKTAAPSKTGGHITHTSTHMFYNAVLIVLWIWESVPGTTFVRLELG